jgi:hypothetical protein
MSFESPWVRAAFSGRGSGLIFMAFGALVLLYALIFGGVRTTERSSFGTDQQGVTDLRNVKESEMLMYRESDSDSDSKDGQTSRESADK